MIKPLLKNMHTTDTYFQRKLAELHSNIGFREILTKASLTGDWNTSEKYHRLKPIVIYNSMDDLMDSIHDNVPISGLVKFEKDDVHKTYVCCIMKDNDIGLYNVIWKNEGEYLFGMWYDKLSISDKPSIMFKMVNDTGTYKEIIYQYQSDYVLLLPRRITLYNEYLYGAITSNWFVHHDDAKYYLPKLNIEDFT